MIQTFLRTAVAVGTILFSGLATAGTLTLNLTDLEVNNGDIRIAVYDSKDTFSKKPAHVLGAASTTESVTVTLNDLPAGEYAVMLYQDSNGNEDLDSNLVGIPTEPWGASLNGTRVFGTPKWKHVMFVVPEEGAQITIALR